MSNIKPFFKRICTYEKNTPLKKARCLLTISVGQQSHEGIYFYSTMQLINRSFKDCVILIDDSLQRHTMALNTNKTGEYFYKESIEEGKAWLHRNKASLEQCHIPISVMHWDYWLQHKDYYIQHRVIRELYEKDPQYGATIDQTIYDFLGKYISRRKPSTQFNKENAFQLCLDFILEECTAMGLWHEMECQFEAYPNEHSAAIELTRERLITRLYPHLLRALTIGFRNTSQLRPQYFQVTTSTKYNFELM